MGEMTLLAPAKLNLTLDILRRRADGYHDLRMVMQSISLGDTVTLKTGVGTGRILLQSGGCGLSTGADNLAYRAAAAFFAATGLLNAGVEIALEKRTPICAGMAGGSSDAAAVLRALQALLAPELPEERLQEIGFSVGSDVPFCLRGGTALAEGRGERLTDLPPLPACHLVICKPDFGLSTPELFGRVKIDDLPLRPDTAGLRRALEEHDLSGVAARLGNVFESVLTPKEGGVIFEIQDVLKKNGALNAVMTGSGPTVFGIFDEKKMAREAALILQSRYQQTFLAKPLRKYV